MSLDASLIEPLLDLAVSIQQIPAPTFHESRRAAFVRQRFQAERLRDISQDKTGNVYARLPGRGSSPPLVVSAHLDTVFPETTDLSVHVSPGKISGPGIGDNALGVAALVGLVWALRDRGLARTLPGNVWLVANVCEEGLGNLVGMRAVVDRFGGEVKGYLVLEGMALGQVYHRGLAVRRYQITAETAGGHSWVDFGKPSAVHALADLVSQLAAVPLPKQPRRILNVGVFTGGQSVNTIAAQASCLVDLRSEGMEGLDELSRLVEAAIHSANRPGVRLVGEIIGERPFGSLPLAHPMVQLAAECLDANGVPPRLNIGSTDANLPLSLGLPAVCIGLTSGGGAHTVQEYIETAALQRGMAQLVDFVCKY